MHRTNHEKKAARTVEAVGVIDPCAFEGEMLDALSSKELGALGERCAAGYLEEHGYEIVERNYRCPEGEADLVAFDPENDEIVLVEVKTRRVRGVNEAIYPEEAVDLKKRRRYRRIAHCYAAEQFPLYSVRFDVIGVTVATGYIAGYEHVCGAYDWDASR